MKKVFFFTGIFIFLLACQTTHSQQEDFHVLTGPYLGQKPPDTAPEIFAPGIISVDENFEHSAAVFSPDGKEVFWCTNVNWYTDNRVADNLRLYTMKMVAGQWTAPQQASFVRNIRVERPVFSHDGNRLYIEYGSDPADADSDTDIYFVEKTANGWSDPKPVSSLINTSSMERLHCVTADGSLYFSRDPFTAQEEIYVSRLVNGKFTRPEKLGESYNSDDYELAIVIHPDEEYMLVNTLNKQHTSSELNILYKKADGSWTERIRVEPPNHCGGFLALSPDGKYLFFLDDAICWISTWFIDELKPQNVSKTPGQEEPSRPVADVFQVMELASGPEIDGLWPGFRVDEIPVLVYDSINTYLFNSKNPAEGFVLSDKDAAVWVYKGQHPLVRGNSIVRLGEDWTATSVLSSFSRRTGEKYDLMDMAGIIVHEQFHIFQRTNHPGWRQNDGLLLIYPEETVETLLLRRMEKKAFEKAVVSAENENIIGWAKQGLQLREDRLGRVAYAFSNYEDELQLTEGLSDYIEKRARQQHPLEASDITNGIAPAGIRDLGYVEGRWIAMIMDMLSPDWKLKLEKNDSLYLEDMLKTVLEESPAPVQLFGNKDIDAMKSSTETDYSEWQARKEAEIEEFYNSPGYRVEIRSPSEPLGIRLFEPLEIEILEDGGVYHRLIFMAGNESGNITIRKHPCITWFNDAYQITKLMIGGLKQSPEIIEAEKRLIINESGMSIQLNYSNLSIDKSLYSVDL